MRQGEAGYWKRLGAACRRFEDLVARARPFAARVAEIRERVEERNRHGGDPRGRRQELDRQIAAYYAEWREFVAEAREASQELTGVLPAHEVEAMAGRLNEAAVGPSVEALEALLERLKEFAGARRAAAQLPRIHPEPRAAASKIEQSQTPGRGGRWVTAAEYAAYAGVSVQTLANWRWQDRKAGREGPSPGKPRYRRFGRSVRYLLTER